MITADEMFEKLGYKKRPIYNEGGICTLCYAKMERFGTTIEINVKTLEVKAYMGKNKTKTGIITLPLLLAIYKKIKELK